MIQVLELKGLKSLRAYNVFSTLMLGIKMLPQYMHESYEEFFSRVQLMPEADQEKVIREATLFVELSKDDLESLICFVADENGVRYGAHNIKNLGPGEIIEIIVAVCMELAKVKIDLVSDDEKKKLKTSQSTSVLHS